MPATIAVRAAALAMPAAAALAMPATYAARATIAAPARATIAAPAIAPPAIPAARAAIDIKINRAVPHGILRARQASADRAYALHPPRTNLIHHSNISHIQIQSAKINTAKKLFQSNTGSQICGNATMHSRTWFCSYPAHYKHYTANTIVDGDNMAITIKQSL
jgi:hypothetical protein